MKLSQRFHHYGRQMVASRSDLQDEIVDAVSVDFPLEMTRTADGRYGLDTDAFNDEVRRRLHAAGSWRSEVAVVDDFGEAVFAYDPDDRRRTGFATSDRFDLAVIDECANARRVWNLLTRFDRLRPDQGERFLRFAEPHLRAHWTEGCDCLRSDIQRRRRDLLAVERAGKLTAGPLAALAERCGELPELPTHDDDQVVLGEVQLGNWGLAYRDAGRILAAREKLVDGQIDFFVIVALDGCLSALISSGTVNFEGVGRVLERMGRQLTVPTWVVGVDFAHRGETHPIA